MRRAVATCTSPEVFFRRTENAPVQDWTSFGYDPLGLAMEAYVPQAERYGAHEGDSMAYYGQ